MDYSLKQRFSSQSNIYGGVSGENSKLLKAVRRSHRRCSVRKDVLRNFANSPVPESLFNKVAG